MKKMNSHTPLLTDTNATNHYQSNDATTNNNNNDNGEVQDITLLSFATPAAARKTTLSRVPSEISEHLISVHQRQAAHLRQQQQRGGRGGHPLDDHNHDGDDANLPDMASDDSESGVFDVIQETFVNLAIRIQHTPPLRLLFVLGLVLLLITGNTMQVVFLNLWLKQYPPDGAPGNYTTFAVSGFLFSAFFLILLILHIALYRPDLRFTKEKRGWLWLVLAGLFDTLNSSLSVYAASHTPAILQALFTALVPVYAAVFTKLFLKDLRSYHNNWIRSSFSLIIAGVILASVSNFGDDDDDGSGGNHTGGNDKFVYMGSGSGSCSSSNSFSGSSSSSSSSGSSGASYGKKDSPFEQKVWAFLFCLSVPFTVLLNVTQTMYMTRYTFDPEFLAYTAQLQVANEPARRIEEHYNVEDDNDDNNEDGKKKKKKTAVEEQVETVQAQRHAGASRSEPFKSDFYKHHSPLQTPEREREQQQQQQPSSADNSNNNNFTVIDVSAPTTTGVAPASPSSPSRGPPPVSPVVAAAAAAHASFHYGNDTTVKLVMLTTETMLQSLLTFMMLPMDALPWYGTSSSVAAAWQNFMAGLDCLLHCPNNFICCCLYSSGFVFVYLGAAYLNQYSVTLCSMVSQMGGPTTAILLLIFPVLNVTGDTAPWYWSAIAIAIMIIGTFIYVLWDNKTEKEKIESELLLKMRMFNLCDDEEVREVEEDVRHGRHHRVSRQSSTRSSATNRQQGAGEEGEA